VTMWRDAAEVYRFALQCGLKLILKGEFGLGLRFWIAPVGYWRVLVNGIVLANARHCSAARVLDLSSPKLMSLMLAARTGADVTATDLDDPRIFDRWKRTADLMGISARYRVEFQDAQRLSYPDRSFDFVYSISVIEHIPGDGDGAAIREIERILRPGGTAVVEVPLRATYTEHFRNTDSKGAPTDAPVFYERHYDVPALRTRLTVDGLPSQIMLLGERMAFDPLISGNMLPRWLRVLVCPFEPPAAFLNYKVVTEKSMARPLAAVLTYRKPSQP
jgi:SAM-dependent methyltransferase